MSPSDFRICIRCGVIRRVNQSRNTGALCRDCCEVTNELDESERWVA